MRTIEKTIYQFSELSEKAKEKVLENERNNFDFSFGQECAIDDAKECAAILGIDVINILYSGFSCRGAGASFTGGYKYKKGAMKAIKQYAPLDTELHVIAKQLQDAQNKNFYKVSVGISQRGYYYHENTMYYDFSHEDDGNYNRIAIPNKDDFEEALQDFARWIYKQLEKEYEYQPSDESLIEKIEANGTKFCEDGSIY